MNTTLTTQNSTTPSTTSATQPVRHHTVRPKVDIYETPEAWMLVLDVPGADETGTEVSLEKQVLSIKADVTDSVPEGFERMHSEFLPRRFERSFRVPEEIDSSGIEASVKNGVLRVKLPKSIAARPHQVPVKAG